MESNEFWEGYHSLRARLTIEACPYRFEPASARDWKRGYRKAVADAKQIHRPGAPQ